MVGGGKDREEMRLIDADKVKFRGEMDMDKSIKKILQEVSENICDNFCKYRDTSDDDCLCDYIRDGSKSCPLDILN